MDKQHGISVESLNVNWRCWLAAVYCHSANQYTETCCSASYGAIYSTADQLAALEEICCRLSPKQVQ